MVNDLRGPVHDLPIICRGARPPLSQTFASDYLQGLTYWRSLPEQADARAALVYGGDASYMRQGMAVLSWQDWE